MRVTLRQVLEQAVVNELIASNPVDRVAALKVVRSTKRALDSHEARRLVHAASTDRLGAAVALLFVHGWRVSEVLGLGWEDIDFGGPAMSTASKSASPPPNRNSNRCAAPHHPKPLSSTSHPRRADDQH